MDALLADVDRSRLTETAVRKAETKEVERVASGRKRRIEKQEASNTQTAVG